jgi:type II secretory pathway pseudopilin PulG
MIIVLSLLVLTSVQIVNIIKTNKQLEKQQQQIEELNRQLDYYQNKESSSDYETIN